MRTEKGHNDGGFIKKTEATNTITVVNLWKIFVHLALYLISSLSSSVLIHFVKAKKKSMKNIKHKNINIRHHLISLEGGRERKAERKVLS